MSRTKNPTPAELRTLARRDPALGRVMRSLEPYPSFPARGAGRTTHYDALARAIVYQQLSGKAAGTIHSDLDRHNFETVDAGVAIGWSRGAQPVELIDETGIDRASDYFTTRDGRLVTKRSIVPIMITTDPEIAASDCLFYVVEKN